MTEIESNLVTYEFLQDAIENAGLEAKIEPDEDRVVVQGLDITCYVSIEAEYNLLTLRTYIRCRENAPIEEIPKLVCELGKTKMVQFSYTISEDGTVYIEGYYEILYKHGFNKKNFLYSLREFSSFFITQFRIMDRYETFFD
jgi:hypothetical protein